MKALIVSLVFLAPLAWGNEVEYSMSDGELEEMLDHPNEDAAADAVDKEIGTFDVATPEPIVEKPIKYLHDGPTPIPSGDKYNTNYAQQAKKKLWSKHSKKVAKKKSKRRDVASKAKKKSKRISRVARR